MSIADFAQEGELQKWKLGNSGPKSKVELVPGPENTIAVEGTCVYEAHLGRQVHSPAPYMPFRRSFDGEAAAKGGLTRIFFWHKGDDVQVVFSEKDRGDAYYASIGSSPDWRRVFVCFADLRWGWNQGGAGKGSFDLARMDAMWLAVAPPPGKSKTFAVADFKLEWSQDDLSPLVFIGGTKPRRLDLYPRTLKLPINRTQPLLVLVRNEKLCGLRGIKIELSVEGAGDISTHGDREGKRRAKSLRLATNDEGKAQARFHPTKTVGESCVIAARIAGTPSVVASSARFTTAPEFHKGTLAPDGFFARPNGHRVLLLGGLFLPWWAKIANGEARHMSRMSVIGASERDQHAWFAYLKANGVNCVRGYWGWGKPIKLGPGGAEVLHRFCVEGKINEPVVAAIERTMAIGGEYGVAFTLTIANCARPFIVPREKAKKLKRPLMHEANDFLREFVPRLMFNPNVWAYELTNEQGSRIFEWSEHFIQTIKELDEVTPVMISHCGGGLQTADPLAWMKRTSIDIYQPHLYPDCGHSLFCSDVDGGLLQEVHYNAMHGPRPWLLGESGGFGTHPPLGPEPDAMTQQYLARDCIWFALLNRSVGASIWGIKHHATTQFKLAAEIAPLVDWKALRDARAMVGVAVPRDISKATFFISGEGKQALEVMADYARWGLESGVTVDFVLDADAYEIRRSAVREFDPPEVEAPFTISKGYQFKYRISQDGGVVVGYLRNIAEISLYKPKARPGWRVTGSYIRRRRPTEAQLNWRLPCQDYSLTVWDLDTGKKSDVPNAGQTGTWRQEQTGHDFVLMWKARKQ